MDLGNGALGRVRAAVDLADELDGVIVSHMHADHFLDLIPLRYALRYEVRRKERLQVYLPPAGISALTHIAHPLKETDDFFGDVFDLREYGPGTSLRIAGCAVTFAPTLHYIPAYAMRVETPGGVLAFSADSAPCAGVPKHAAGADVFLCECALGADGVEDGPVKGHMNAGDAGAMAAEAGVKHLVLTHYGAGADPAELLRAASAQYGGRITVADDGLEIDLVESLVDEHV